MTKTHRFLLAAGVLLAIAFTFSCSTGDIPNPNEGEGNPNQPGGEENSQKDGSVSYGGQTYETLKIGEQTWFAENLNYNPNTGYSACYNNQESNCAIYGRLYDWSTAMAISNSYNGTNYGASAEHQGICPSGWRIPNNADWDALMTAVGGNTGVKLKATSGWSGCSPSGSPYLCEDIYGFSALPGGGGDFGGSSFANVGDVGNWWSTSEDGSYNAYGRYMHYNNEIVDRGISDKRYLFSVRCVQGYSGSNIASSSSVRSSSSQMQSISSSSVRSSSSQIQSISSSSVRSSSSQTQSSSSSVRSSSSSSGIVYGSLTYEGYTYKTVKIGTQTWMAEDLSYNPGTGTNGRVYDWETAMYVCPASWHLPSIEEWKTLVNFVGGEEIAGNKLNMDYYGGTDDYGFSARLGGYGLYSESSGRTTIYDSGIGYWWSASKCGNAQAYVLILSKNYKVQYAGPDAARDLNTILGGTRLSVRCVKD